MNYQDIFHTGLLVTDLPGAMRFYERAFGISFAEPQQLKDFPIWTPEAGVQQIDIIFTYSNEGPQHIELQYGTPGTPYDPLLHRGDHVGLWVDDVAGEVGEMLTQGWRVKVSSLPPEQGYGAFTYLEPVAGGMVVELVSRTLEPVFQRWWTTGKLEI